MYIYILYFIFYYILYYILKIVLHLFFSYIDKFGQTTQSIFVFLMTDFNGVLYISPRSYNLCQN